jgi:hypothetical protein
MKFKIRDYDNGDALYGIYNEDGNFTFRFEDANDNFDDWDTNWKVVFEDLFNGNDILKTWLEYVRDDA